MTKNNDILDDLITDIQDLSAQIEQKCTIVPFTGVLTTPIPLVPDLESLSRT